MRNVVRLYGLQKDTLTQASRR